MIDRAPELVVTLALSTTLTRQAIMRNEDPKQKGLANSHAYNKERESVFRNQLKWQREAARENGRHLDAGIAERIDDLNSKPSVH